MPYLAAVAIALTGPFMILSFIQVGAEAATVKFSPGTATQIGERDRAVIALGSGEHALFGYLSNSGSCSARDARGQSLGFSVPAVEFTDNGDGIVIELIGLFRTSGSDPVTIECIGESGALYVGSPPIIRGAAGHLIRQSPLLARALGLVPGILVLVYLLTRTPQRRNRLSTGH